jgi:hypothetical protein
MFSQINEVKSFLVEGVCRIQFQKKDGSTRVLMGTLEPSYFQDDTSLTSTQRKPTANTVLAVWDTENEGWRSFIWDNLISVEVPMTPSSYVIEGPLYDKA